MSTTAITPGVLELLRFTETHQRHSEALARATGEHFNIFNILGVGHLEVTTHSPVLAELLNPKGKHGQGAAFLRLFLAQFEIIGFDTESETASMKTEYYAGPVTEESGGRLDIVVKDGKGSTVLIENKIYAGDQDNQMERYRAFDRKAHLFYLTLDGRNPSNYAGDELNRIQCKCISYTDDILEWLKECRQAAACLPNVRETLTQYIHLIEELTLQSTTTRMNDELICEILDSKDSLRAFFTLRDADEAVRTALIARLDTKLDEIADATGLKRMGSLGELHKKESGFAFTTPALSLHSLQIEFVFGAGNYSDFYFGFVKTVPDQSGPIEAQLLSAFTQHFPASKPTEYWPAWAYWEAPYRYWRHEAFEAIRSGQFAEALKAKVETLANIAREVCPDEAIPA